MHKTVTMPLYDIPGNYDTIMQTLNMRGQILVTRDGKEEAVMINAEDFAAFEEFLHTQYVCRELKKAEDYAANPNAEWVSADDFFKRAWMRLEKDEAYGELPRE
ncbi:MAG: hypothetical protein FWG70_10990 [Oscillospiraceae bacterium]|nr:hypothetical protein [Oscillospiraceae bacterium]